MIGSSNSPQVAYFSMELALDPSVPTHGGGLGVLAGDTLRASADLGCQCLGSPLSIEMATSIRPSIGSGITPNNPLPGIPSGANRSELQRGSSLWQLVCTQISGC